MNYVNKRTIITRTNGLWRSNCNEMVAVEWLINKLKLLDFRFLRIYHKQYSYISITTIRSSAEEELTKDGVCRYYIT